MSVSCHYEEFRRPSSNALVQFVSIGLTVQQTEFKIRSQRCHVYRGANSCEGGGQLSRHPLETFTTNPVKGKRRRFRNSSHFVMTRII